MHAFFNTTAPFYKDVPLPLLERYLREKGNESLEIWGVRTTANDAYSITVELSGCNSPQQFLEWCSVFDIVRCDVTQPSDITIFLGRNPVTLGLIDAWQSQQSVRDALTSLQPSELYETMQNLACQALDAGSQQLDLMQEYALGNDLAAYDLHAMESNAALVLEEQGFSISDDSAFRNPAKPAPFANDEEFYNSYGAVNPRPRRKDAFGFEV